MARTVDPPTGRTLVSRGPGDLVGLKRPASRPTAPRPSGTRDGPASSRACSRRPVESGSTWFVASFHSGFMFGDRNRTPATDHVPSFRPQPKCATNRALSGNNQYEWYIIDKTEHQQKYLFVLSQWQVIDIALAER